MRLRSAISWVGACGQARLDLGRARRALRAVFSLILEPATFAPVRNNQDEPERLPSGPACFSLCYGVLSHSRMIYAAKTTKLNAAPGAPRRLVKQEFSLIIKKVHYISNSWGCYKSPSTLRWVATLRPRAR